MTAKQTAREKVLSAIIPGAQVGKITIQSVVPDESPVNLYRCAMVYGVCECGALKQSFIGVFYNAHKTRRPFACKSCLQKANPRQSKQSGQGERLIAGLDAFTRERVDEIIRKHVEACRKYGVPIECLDRLYIEAVEVAKLPEEPVRDSSVSEPYRRYRVYDSPKVEV